MQFEFKNLGTIKEAQLEMGNLTVICGKNNTGKTYLTYAVWGIIKYEINDLLNHIHIMENINEYVETYNVKNDIIENGKARLVIPEQLIEDYIAKVENSHQLELSNIFASDKAHFENYTLEIVEISDFDNLSLALPENNLNTHNSILLDLKKSNIDINSISEVFNYKGVNIHIEHKNDLIIHINVDEKYREKYIKNIPEKDIHPQDHFPVVFIFGLLTAIILPFKLEIPNTFVLPAQRDSIELFYKELDKNRSHLLEKLRFTKDLSLLDKESSRFPQPIEKLIDFARDLTRQVIKTESFLAKEQPELLQEIESLLGVTYEVLGDEVLIKDKNSSQKVPAYMASTSVRSLMHLHFWLKHKAQKGDLLMIDEPELNLHPENQIKMARLFAKLVNVGIKVWITTHSDYIIKELNNCLMFSQEIENKPALLEELGYKENEILKREDIRAYIARYDEKLEGCTVDKVEFDEYGMVMTTFDEQAKNINRIANRLADEIDEEKLKQTTLDND